MRMARRIVGAFAALVLLVAALVVWLPLAPLGERLLPPGFAVVEGSTVRRGSVLGSLSGSGSQVWHWRWCPAAGPLAFCTRVKGDSGAASAVARPRPGRLVLEALSFSGVSTAALGMRDSALSGVVAGELERLVIPAGDCPLRRLQPGRGVIRLAEARLAGRDFPPHRLRVAPTESGATLSLEGERARGQLRLGPDGRLEGRFRINSDSGEMPLTIDRRLPCGWANTARRNGQP